jgi:hypothetical protein
MFKYLLSVLVVVLLFVVVHNIIKKNNLEGFQNNSANVDVNMLGDHPDFALRDQAQIVSEEEVGNAASENPLGIHNDEESPQRERYNNMDDYVSRSDIERAARASAMKYCPVTPDYNPADYMKKSEIDLETACPKMPDLKDYVLKSTIPPVQKCPACVCPKVKVSAGMCKKCPEPKNNCPKPEPCGIEQCRTVIKCAPGDQPVHCPKCPAPEACPEPPEKVCPAFELPESDLQCPSPKPCPLPGSCPDGQSRCPEAPESNCKYYGIKEVVQERSVNDIVNELLLSDDPDLQELLENLKSKLDINLNPPPTNLNSNNNNNILPTVPVTGPPRATTSQAPRATTSQAPRATTSQAPRATTSQAPRATTSQAPRATTTQAPRATTSQNLMTNNVANNLGNNVPAPSPTTNSLLPGSETNNAQPFNPQAMQSSDNQYEYNSYAYSTLNRLNFMGEPNSTYNSNIQSTPLQGASNMGCNLSDGNCSYNTNLPI